MLSRMYDFFLSVFIVGICAVCAVCTLAVHQTIDKPLTINRENQNRWCKSFAVKLGMQYAHRVNVQWRYEWLTCSSFWTHPQATHFKWPSQNAVREDKKWLISKDFDERFTEKRKNWMSSWTQAKEVNETNYNHLPRHSPSLDNVFSSLKRVHDVNVNFALFEYAPIELDLRA